MQARPLQGGSLGLIMAHSPEIDYTCTSHHCLKKKTRWHKNQTPGGTCSILHLINMSIYMGMLSPKWLENSKRGVKIQHYQGEASKNRLEIPCRIPYEKHQFWKFQGALIFQGTHPLVWKKIQSAIHTTSGIKGLKNAMFACHWGLWFCPWA